MADKAKTKTEEAAEKAYAEAAAAVKAAPAPAKKPAAKKAPVKKKAAPKKVAAKTPAPAKAAPKKSVAKKKALKKAAPKPMPAPVKEVAPVAKAAPVPAAKKASPKKTSKTTTIKAAPAKKIPVITDLKDKIMAKTTSDFTKTVKDAAAEVQSKLKAAYTKGSEFVSEATEFNKANVEAIVASGKVLASAAQEMGRDAVEETKSAFDTMTADAKKMAGIKSPTELFQLQGELARRNFDAMVAASSKNTEKMIKIANDAFAPLSSRMSVATEKFTKAA